MEIGTKCVCESTHLWIRFPWFIFKVHKNRQIIKTCFREITKRISFVTTKMHLNYNHDHTYFVKEFLFLRHFSFFRENMCSVLKNTNLHSTGYGTSEVPNLLHHEVVTFAIFISTFNWNYKKNLGISFTYWALLCIITVLRCLYFGYYLSYNLNSQ